MTTPRRWFAYFALFVSLTVVLSAQDLTTRPESVKPQGPPKAPNSNAIYQAIRNAGLGSEAYTVTNFVLKRDVGTFTLTKGTVCFLQPVEGKITGAVFSGSGTFNVTPAPQARGEVRQISILTREAKLDENFDELILRFSDVTAEEIAKAGTKTTGGCSQGALDSERHQLAKDIQYNVAGRILQDVLSGEPGDFFMAIIRGKKYSSKMLFVVDAHGAAVMGIEPEEVGLMTYDDMKWGVWGGYHLQAEYESGSATGNQHNAYVDAEHHAIEATFDKSGKLSGKATLTFVSQVKSLRVVPLDLFPSLRVESVINDKGEQLEFIQEKKEEDAQFYVVLPQAVGQGQKYSITTTYSGKDAVLNEGEGNYFPVARSNWYPNTRFGDFATYDLTFLTPKKMQMVGTGKLVRQIDEGDHTMSVWHSDTPLAVAGFNFGRFKKQEATLKEGYSVQAFANENPPDMIKGLQHAVEHAENAGLQTGMALGTMSTTAMLQQTMSEAQVSLKIYDDYFGPAMAKTLAVTQQTADNFGQSWPGLVYLPISYFFDITTRHQLYGFDIRGYFKVVAPHEVAHQWWGHTVGWNGYRDQWMSEGFSEFSASLFLQYSRKDLKEYLQFWKEERDLMLDKNKEGFRPVDIGPLTMGRRLSSRKAGPYAYTHLVYPKGGYILQMVRFMMYDPKTGDQKFKDLMHDFVKTYTNRDATTEDFKAMVEKHMTPGMDLDGNGKMDWFFNEYVYGTAVPRYTFEHNFSNGPDGTTIMRIKLTQSGVDERFKMLIPLYLELGDGRVVRLGSANLTGNTFIEQQVPLGKLPSPPKRAVINYYYDVLAEN